MTVDVANVPLAEINAFDPQLLQDPYPYFERLRGEAPVFRDPKTNIVYISTYELVQKAARDYKRFTNAFGEALRGGGAPLEEEVEAILAKGYPPVETMLSADPPIHTRYKSLVTKAFNAKRVSQMGAYVETVVNDLIDGFIADGTCEFKKQFADELPMRVIADQIGVPRADMGLFRKWSNAFIGNLGGLASLEEKKANAQMIVDFQHYMAAKAEEKRANPTEDVLSDLVQVDLAEEGDPRKLEMPEILNILQQILVAGNETTAHSLTAGVNYMLTYPDQFALLKEDMQGRVAGLVEETLRFLTPVNNMWRVAGDDFDFEGVAIKKGDMVLMRYGSANRDDAKFEDPDTFNILRKNASAHFAFGHGIHTCLGMMLARKEMQVAFPIVFDRLKNLRFSQGKNTFQYNPNILLRGVLQLHLDFDPA